MNTPLPTKSTAIHQIIEQAVRHNRAHKDRERGASLLTIANGIIRGNLSVGQALAQRSKVLSI
jgi:nitrous oxidase accessory protein NosD